MWYRQSQVSQQYKSEQLISDFAGRNLVNAQIRAFGEMVDSLDEAIAISQQTQSGAASIVQKILADKKISSFPECITALRVAIAVVKDSPKKFNHYCDIAAAVLEKKIDKLISMRNDFAANPTDKKVIKKGLF